jgi:thiol-disulfide isomerase/thioredoxin
MKSLVNIYLLFLLSARLPVSSQSLSIGSDISSLELKNVFNYSAQTLKLSDFKSKLVIFDFWSFRCLSCIYSFPKMTEIQSQMKDKIQIIFVNEESKAETENFFAKKSKHISLPPMPFITGDTLLNKYFPNNGVPFHVWVDGNGIVRHFNYGSSTTKENILKFLQGSEVHFAKYNTGSFYEPLFNDKWRKDIEYSSSIVNARSGVNLGADIDTSRNACLKSRGTIVKLYQSAFNELGKNRFDKAGRTILELSDISKYTRPADPNAFDYWKSNYTYSYMLVLPKERKSRFFEIMKADLERYFGLDAKIERRNIPCLVLTSMGDESRFKSRGGKSQDKFYQDNIKRSYSDSIRFFRNYPFQEFSKRFCILVESVFGLPFISEVNYNGNIDLFIEGRVVDSGSIEEMQKALKHCGFNLELVERGIDVLVIKDANEEYQKL